MNNENTELHKKMEEAASLLQQFLSDYKSLGGWLPSGLVLSLMQNVSDTACYLHHNNRSLQQKIQSYNDRKVLDNTFEPILKHQSLWEKLHPQTEIQS